MALLLRALRAAVSFMSISLAGDMHRTPKTVEGMAHPPHNALAGNAKLRADLGIAPTVTAASHDDR